MTLRGEFYKTVLPVIREELPGCRTDLQQKIASRIAAKLARSVSDLETEAKRAAERARIAEQVKKMTAQTALGGIEKIMATLEVEKRRMREINGKEANH